MAKNEFNKLKISPNNLKPKSGVGFCCLSGHSSLIITFYQH